MHLKLTCFRVKDMMKRSFAEIDSAQNEDNRVTELEELKDKIASMSEITCSKCVPSLDEYYIKCSDINMLRQEVQVHGQLLILTLHPLKWAKVEFRMGNRLTVELLFLWMIGTRTSLEKIIMVCSSYVDYSALPHGVLFVQDYFPQKAKLLQPGRVITIYIAKYKFVLAMVLKVSAKMTVFLLCNSDDDQQIAMQTLVDETEENLKTTSIFHKFERPNLPDPPLKHAIVEVSGLLLVNITEEVIKVDPLKIIGDYQRRQLPRFW